MENFKSPESRESIIRGLIENPDVRENLSYDDILTNMIVFAGLYEEDEDEDVVGYFESLTKDIKRVIGVDVSVEELLSYAKKKEEDYLEEQEGE